RKGWPSGPMILTVFLPLLVGATFPLGPAKDHHDVGCLANLGFAFFRIPEQVTGDEDIAIAPEERLETLLDQDDPFELKRVFRQGLTIIVRVLDRGLWRLGECGAHDPGASGLDGRMTSVPVCQVVCSQTREFATAGAAGRGRGPATFWDQGTVDGPFRSGWPLSFVLDGDRSGAVPGTSTGRDAGSSGASVIPKRIETRLVLSLGGGVIAPRSRPGSPGGARPGARRLPNRARLAAKKRPSNRPADSFCNRACQFSALLPRRSKIPSSSAEITALPSRNNRPVYSTRSR